MAVAFDAVGAGGVGSNLTGSPVGNSCAHTAALGADVFLALKVSYTGSPDTVEYNGTTLTLLGIIPANNSTAGRVALYHGAGLGTGSSENFTFNIPATSYFCAESTSYTGVSSVGTAVTAYGSGTSPSSGSVSCTTGQMIVCAVGGGDYNGPAGSTMSATSGGTNRSRLNSPASGSYVSLALSDSTSTVTFGATLSHTQPWSTVAVVLSPASGSGTITPSGIASTEAFGTPAVSGGPVSLAVSGIASTEAFGSPAVRQGPLSPIRSKLAASQDAAWLALGDSTDFSAWDTGFSELTTPWTPGTLFGWVGRDAIALGDYYDATVQICYWNYPTDTGYTTFTTLRTGTGPTLTVYLGGWPGATMSTYITEGAPLLPVISFDLISMQDGFNEPNATTFAANYSTYIDTLQSTYPGVPILCTTANATTETREGGNPTFASLFAAMLGVFFTGVTQPMSPPLQYSTKKSGVWVLDTQQAGQTAATLYSDGLHPIGPGYAQQTSFMLQELAPDIYAALLQTISPTGIAGAEAFGTSVVSESGVVYPSGVPSGEVFGTPTATPGVVDVNPTGIASGETFGVPAVVMAGPQAIQPTGIPSDETFGTAVINSRIDVLPQNYVLVPAESRSTLV